MPPRSRTHRIAASRHDGTEAAPPAREPAGLSDLDRRTDQQSADSFPASDAPSTWPGPDPAAIAAAAGGPGDPG